MDGSLPLKSCRAARRIHQDFVWPCVRFSQTQQGSTEEALEVAQRQDAHFEKHMHDPSIRHPSPSKSTLAHLESNTSAQAAPIQPCSQGPAISRHHAHQPTKQAFPAAYLEDICWSPATAQGQHCVPEAGSSLLDLLLILQPSLLKGTECVC